MQSVASFRLAHQARNNLVLIEFLVMKDIFFKKNVSLSIETLDPPAFKAFNVPPTHINCKVSYTHLI